MATLKDDPDELRDAYKALEQSIRQLRDRPHVKNYVAVRFALDSYFEVCTGTAPPPPLPTQQA